MPHIVAAAHAVKKPPEALILELREIGDRILRRSNCGTLCCADMGTNSLVDPIAGFHGFSVCGWRLLIRYHRHIGSQTCRVAVVVKLPPSMIAPVAISISAAVPYPVFLPPRPPDTPICGCHLCFLRQVGKCKVIFPVIRIWIWRWILIQIHDIHMDRSFIHTASAVHFHRDCHRLRLVRCCPANPRQLAVSIRIVHLIYCIGITLYMECHRNRMVRITLTATHFHRCNHFGIGTIFIIICADFRRRCHFIKPDNTNSQRRFNITVRCRRACAAAPCGITEIRCFEKNGKRKILMGKRHHSGTQTAAKLLVIQCRFGCGCGNKHSLKRVISYRLNKQFIFSGYHCVKVHPGQPSNAAQYLFIGKVTFYFLNAGGSKTF